MTRANWPRVWTVALGVLAGAVASVGTGAVAVAGFTLSYDAIRAVGIAARIRPDWAWLLPVSVDGAMAVATVAAVVLRRLAGRTAWYPWSVVIVGALISIGCNGLHSTSDVGRTLTLTSEPIRFAVSAIPSVMLAQAIHLLVTLVDVTSRTRLARSTSETILEVTAASPKIQKLEDFDHDTPVPDDTLSDTRNDTLPDTQPPEVSSRPTGAAVKIAELRARNPAIKQQEVATRAQVSLTTVKRHWGDTHPDTPLKVNGTPVPDLIATTPKE